VNQEESLRRDIRLALDPISGATPDLVPGIVQRLHPMSHRRPFVAIAQVAAALSIAVVVAAVAFSLHRARVTPGPVTTSPATPIVMGAGANIAWVGNGIGIDPSGRVVGRTDAPVDLRSPDGAHLYGLVGDEVHVYSAADGHVENIITLPLMSGGLPMLSEDGRYLGVVTKTKFQLVDLATGRQTDVIDVGSPAYGVAVIVGPQAQHIYIVGDTVTRVAYDGARLRVDGHSTGSSIACNGLVVGGPNSSGGLPFRVLPDGQTLVAFCPGDGRVTWYDLSRMSVAHEVKISIANPFWVSPVFAPDGNTLYLFEGGTGSLNVVDLVHRTVRPKKVAAADSNPLAWIGSLLVAPAYAGGIDRTAAVTPDGTWLYTVGDFGMPGGVSVVHLPDLAVKGKWLSDVALGSVWVSGDGQTIYLLGQNRGEVRVLHTDGSQVAKVTLPTDTIGFIVPTVP
jgi:hypothetical protein